MLVVYLYQQGVQPFCLCTHSQSGISHDKRLVYKLESLRVRYHLKAAVLHITEPLRAGYSLLCPQNPDHKGILDFKNVYLTSSFLEYWFAPYGLLTQLAVWDQLPTAGKLVEVGSLSRGLTV